LSVEATDFEVLGDLNLSPPAAPAPETKSVAEPTSAPTPKTKSVVEPATVAAAALETK
jgi:hypothetical protein